MESFLANIFQTHMKYSHCMSRHSKCALNLILQKIFPFFHCGGHSYVIDSHMYGKHILLKTPLDSTEEKKHHPDQD